MLKKISSKKLNHDKIVPFNKSTETKKEQVAVMFNRIAKSYDLLNHLLSANIDKLWRKKAIEKLKENSPAKILDVATGTGDFAIMALKILKPKKIIGIDISEKMIEIGKKKIEKLNLQNYISLEAGDSEKLNFPKNSFDAVTVAFGVRNFENLFKGITEIHRVLKKNGKVVILEFSKPKNIFIKPVYNFYLTKLVPAVGKLISQSGEAYSYLNKSVLAFPEGDEFLQILERAGFSKIDSKKLTFGICSIYTGIKQ